MLRSVTAWLRARATGLCRATKRKLITARVASESARQLQSEWMQKLVQLDLNQVKSGEVGSRLHPVIGLSMVIWRSSG